MPRAELPEVIRYGRESLGLTLPRGEQAAWVEPVRPERPAGDEEIIRDALRAPIGSPPLSELARGKRSAAILVPGKDRVAAASRYVPLLAEELNRTGIPDEAIEVVLATGTHAKHTAQDAAEILGPEAASRLRWRQHDPRDESRLRPIGVTSYGTRVEMDGDVLDADIKVLTGRIIPHYFAGFGGGRKALLPGVSSVETILQNHRLTLDPRDGIHPHIRPCSLAGNPVHLDMLEAARFVESTFVLNTLLDTEHRVIGAVAGELAAAHGAGCTRAKEIFQVGLDGPVDAVVTSAGGWPYDCNFVQALKAAFDVQEIVRDGGTMLWIAECRAGMKEGFGRWAQIESDDELEKAVRADYDLAGHNSIMLRKLLRRVRVGLWSGLPDDEVRALGLEPVHSLSEGIDWLCGVAPDSFRYAVVPYANVTHVTLTEGKA